MQSFPRPHPPALSLHLKTIQQELRGSTGQEGTMGLFKGFLDVESPFIFVFQLFPAIILEHFMW